MFFLFPSPQVIQYMHIFKPCWLSVCPCLVLTVIQFVKEKNKIQKKTPGMSTRVVYAVADVCSSCDWCANLWIALKNMQRNSCKNNHFAVAQGVLFERLSVARSIQNHSLRSSGAGGAGSVKSRKKLRWIKNGFYSGCFQKCFFNASGFEKYIFWKRSALKIRIIGGRGGRGVSSPKGNVKNAFLRNEDLLPSYTMIC